MESKEIMFDFVNRVKNDGALDEGNSKYKLPQKGSKKAAGYDFYSAEDVVVNPFKSPEDIVYVKTGVKSLFSDNVGLFLLNRSSNPKKKGLFLANGVGLVDADYYNNESNEGEIAFPFMNLTDEPITINIGDKLGQGVFIEYKDATNYFDKEIPERKGGFGSTDA